MIITHVFAIDVALGLGYANGQLLFHCSEDMKRFKEYTTGKAVVMGRKTYDSIGKALPNRDNYVLSRTMPKLEDPAVCVCHSVSELMDVLSGTGYDEVCIIGGGEIYKETAPLVDKLVYTTFYDSVSEAGVTYPMAEVLFSNPNVDFEVCRSETLDLPVTNVRTGSKHNMKVGFTEAYILKEI